MKNYNMKYAFLSLVAVLSYSISMVVIAYKNPRIAVFMLWAYPLILSTFIFYTFKLIFEDKPKSDE